MVKKKSNKEPDNQTYDGVKKEMAKPRISRSARIAELNLDTTRIAEQPSTTFPGIVEKLIRPGAPEKPDKAQIAVEGHEKRYRSLRIENVLTDEHGQDVRLKKGSHVEVTVTAKNVNRRPGQRMPKP
jgi:hypothetical protein